MSFFAWGVVLFVGDLLHPVDDLAAQLFLDGDVSHRGGRRGAMPMLLAGLAPDHITGSNHLDRSAPALHVPAAGRDDQRLAERTRVTVAARARSECDLGAACTRGFRLIEAR